MGIDKSDHRIKLFEPIELREVRARNRIMISPMCQYCAENAVPSDWHFVHLASRAVGGAGIVMTEATAVEPAGRITPFDIGLWSEEQESALSRIASVIKDHSALPGIQLAHAGRKASHARPWEDRLSLSPEEGGWEVVGPSPIPWNANDLIPRELSADEIALLTEKFRAAANRALRAGFLVLELHAAHGYLFHSFLSPLTNHRRDAYGGDFDGRSKFLRETVEAVRDVWPESLPLFVRLSVTDWAEGGWGLADSIRLAKRLSSMGVDAIDCSSGGAVPEGQMSTHTGYQVPLSDSVRREAQVKTVAVGLISEPALANEIVSNGRADIVAIGRLALWDPYWPYHAAKVLKAEIELPKQYARANIFG